MHTRLELGIFCTESIRDSRCSTATVKRPRAWCSDLTILWKYIPRRRAKRRIGTGIYPHSCCLVESKCMKAFTTPDVVTFSQKLRKPADFDCYTFGYAI
ncbi:hypothetical protein EVAR_6709_1 [Eumeta japonica]|uniref:Uncharacterized protein n=1 Tax=Eumeta variegata TaxID=151549 RepID=A0A4C1TNB9_EUMVA|nr:hypothetical protein EVAR_6709_1 [Eumeta japonica]